MSGRRALSFAQALGAGARALGLDGRSQQVIIEPVDVAVYDRIVTDAELRLATRQLFADGHYAQSVEEACKCVSNVVKLLASDTERDGANLMRHALSPKGPILRLNRLVTRSEKDQQQGYMDMFAGIMTGVRNPRAHEHAYLDDPATALELLAFTNHLVRMARAAMPTCSP